VERSSDRHRKRSWGRKAPTEEERKKTTSGGRRMNTLSVSERFIRGEKRNGLDRYHALGRKGSLRSRRC